MGSPSGSWGQGDRASTDPILYRPRGGNGKRRHGTAVHGTSSGAAVRPLRAPRA